MKKGLVEIVFILDRSGSMSHLTEETILGYNRLLEQQKEVSAEAVFSTVLFNEKMYVLHNRVPIGRVPFISREVYFADGTTALLDAVGRSIRKIGGAHKELNLAEQPEKVLFVITTDGMENASREFTYRQVRQMIMTKQEEGWEFVFLGANIDAFATSESLGIRRDRTARYHYSGRGVIEKYEHVNQMMTDFRTKENADEAFENLKNIKDDDDKDAS